MNVRERFGISGSTLKLIAIVSMLIDHTGATVVAALSNMPAFTQDAAARAQIRQLYTVMRGVGRLAFPIFCFLLVEGFLHTRSKEKYAQRLFLFALLSEIPFDWALKNHWFFPRKQNVYFTLLFGLLALWGISCLEGKVVLQLAVLVAAMRAAALLQTDYGLRGVFEIEVIYLLRHNRLLQCLGGAAAISWENWAPLSFVPAYLYNGKRGLRLKYVFYFFYPAHLMVLGFITKVILPRMAM